MGKIILNKFVIIFIITVLHCIFFRDVFLNINSYLIFGDINPYELNTQKWITDSLYLIYPYNGTGVIQPPYIIIWITGLLYNFMGYYLNPILLSKFLLIIYIIIAPSILFFFIDKFLKRYIDEKGDVIATIIGVSIIIFSLLINQIFLYPLTYFYYSIIFIPLILFAFYKNNFLLYSFGLLGLFIFVGTSQILLLNLGLIFTFILFDIKQKNNKNTRKYLLSISFLLLFYLLPLVLYFLFRDTNTFNEILTKSAINTKESFPMKDSLRLFTSWFTQPYRTPLGETLPRNPYNFYNSNFLLVILSFIPIGIIILGFIKKSYYQCKYIHLFLSCLFIIHFIFLKGFLTYTFFDEVFRGSEKFVTNILLILGLISSIVLYNFRITLKLLILFLIIISNTKIFTGDLLLREVWLKTHPSIENNINDLIGNERVLYLPLIKNNPWTPLKNGQFSYSVFPILYNTKSFSQNVGDINADILEISSFSYNGEYNINNEKLSSIVEKYKIEKIVVYKQYSFEYHFSGFNIKNLINELNKFYKEIYADDKIIIFDTGISKGTSILSTKLNTSININPTHYSFIKNSTEKERLYFLQSFHPQWKLYLEPYSEIDCKNPNTYTGSLNEKTESYTVQAGDNYQKIVANNTGVTLESLRELNPEIDERDLKIGQTITLKKSAGDRYNVTECESENKFYAGGELSKIWEKPIFEDTHTMVYDYANQWTIDPEYIKANYSKEYYRENPDGSIDVRITLYFKPQSYFYLGLIISGTTLILLLSYLGYDAVRSRRRGNPKIDISEKSV